MADINNTIDELKGDAKEGLGKATGNDRLEAEGKTESTAAEVKGKVGDAAGALGDKARGAAEGLKNAFGND